MSFCGVGGVDGATCLCSQSAAGRLAGVKMAQLLNKREKQKGHRFTNGPFEKICSAEYSAAIYSLRNTGFVVQLA